MIGLEPVPEPSEEVKKIIKEDVYRIHNDSSDDEWQTDEAFKKESKAMVHDLIYSLNDHTIEAI